MSSNPPIKTKKKTVKTGEKKKTIKKNITKENVSKVEENVSKVEENIPTVEEESNSINSTLVSDTSIGETTNIIDESNITDESNIVHDSKSDDKKDPITDILNTLLNKYEILEKDSRNNKNELKKVIKLYQKKSFKHKRKHNPNRTPSGFAKPSTITDELCKFLNKPNGSKMARTDVTREVNNYIKKNNLQNPDNKKKITPDETLRSLLKIEQNDNTLTYFSMQKYLKDHFPKEDNSVVS